MPAVVVRNLPEQTLRALKARARAHGRSTEAEIRTILQRAVEHTSGVGSALAAIGRAASHPDLPPRRRRSPIRPAQFDD